MFEIGWTEILLIAVVAIVVIGPKDLPRVMRIVGQWTGKMKRMGREFQNQFQEALREAELEDVRKDIADIMATDPLKDVKTEMAKVESGLKTDLGASSAVMTGPAVSAPAEPAAPVAGLPVAEAPVIETVVVPAASESAEPAAAPVAAPVAAKAAP
jgi:sec-independent protein translocase protein TatB